MKKIVFFTVLIFLNACCWRSPDSQFYVLDSAGLSPLSQRSLNISVAAVKVPELLDRQQMVTYEKNSRQINILEFNRWAAALPYVLQSAITNDLIAYLPKSYIQPEPFSGRPQYIVNVEINRLEAYPADRVKLSVWWNIANADGTVLTRRQNFYEEKVNGADIADLTAAQNRAVNRLTADIAAKLANM